MAPPHIRLSISLLTGILLLLLIAPAVPAQVPHPKDVYGFTPGDDHQLADYGQMLDYYHRLAASSGRIQLREIGRSVLGKPLLLLTISSEENMQHLDRYRGISEQLARARVDDTTAQQLANEGKAVVWIDGGLHATEVAHGQMTSLLAHRLVTEESTEMQKIRDRAIVLLMPVMNPDGLDIVVNWYKQNRGTPYETRRPPVLYHHYIGHDNNRDWFMNNMPESKGVTNLLYNEWYPQIVYNHHQTGPSWTRIFIPPFADPVNPNIHPGVTTGVNMVGSAMANRFALKEMPGAVSGVIYSMWWNGGMRTVPYFHNMIGLLTETSHASATPRFFDPDSIPKSIASRRGSGHPTDGTNVFYAYPWRGGESHLSDPVRYMVTASMAVLRIATDMKEHWLYNIYEMGRDAIVKGEAGGPHAYIIPADQWNDGEDTNLLNILQIGGVEIQRATEGFRAGRNDYPAGTYIVYAGQAFRPYVLDLLDKQVYPNRQLSPGGPPEPPYDIAGWTLPMQMGVRVDRIEDAFQAATEPVIAQLAVESGNIEGDADYGYLLSHRPNASVLAVNRLLKDGERVYLAAGGIGPDYDAGTFVIRRRGNRTDERIDALAKDLGLDFNGIAYEPKTALHQLEAPRVAIYKSWVANMDEGWTRWLLNGYAFAPDTLHNADIQRGDLSKYHAIILPHQGSSTMLNGHAKGTMPDAYVGGLGPEGTVALKHYVDEGGRIVALDGASDFLIQHFGLPVQNAVSGVSSRQFFIPGSLIRMDVDASHPMAYGMEPEATASFVRSRAFRLVRLSGKGEGGTEDLPEAPKPYVETVASYAKEDILMSGWALGEKKYIGGKASLIRIPIGEGDVILFGFRPQFRGQPRGTYKLFFNALHNATLEQLPVMRREVDIR